VSKVFGSGIFERYGSDVTLLESTTRNDDENAFAGLLKQASAALLNSYAREGFPYSAWEVKTLLIQALVSKEAAATPSSSLLPTKLVINYKLVYIFTCFCDQSFCVFLCYCCVALLPRCKELEILAWILSSGVLCD